MQLIPEESVLTRNGRGYRRRLRDYHALHSRNSMVLNSMHFQETQGGHSWVF